MEWVALIGGSSVAVAAIIALIITIHLASSRSDRADKATDSLLEKVSELDGEKTLHAGTQRSLDVAVENTRRLEAALSSANLHVTEVETSAAALEESFHDLVSATINTSGGAGVATLQVAASRAADQLRAALGRVRTQTQAVPGVPSATAAADPGGGEAGQLPARSDGQ